MNTLIAVAVKNPARIATCFGECAGDYKNDACLFWAGTEGELFPVAEVPEGHELVDALVSYSGGTAWVKAYADGTPTARQLETEREERRREAARKADAAAYREFIVRMVRRFAAGWGREAETDPGLIEMGYTPEELRENSRAEVRRITEGRGEFPELAAEFALMGI